MTDNVFDATTLMYPMAQNYSADKFALTIEMFDGYMAVLA